MNEKFLIKTKNKLHIDKQMSVNFGIRKHLEVMYSVEAIKKEVFFTSLKVFSPKISTFDMLESSLLKILS